MAQVESIEISAIVYHELMKTKNRYEQIIDNVLAEKFGVNPAVCDFGFGDPEACQYWGNAYACTPPVDKSELIDESNLHII